MSHSYPNNKQAASPRRLLVVDDNREVAESLAMVLRYWGHDVHLAYDGPEAIAAAQTLQPDVVLLDIGLPGMDGYQVVEQLLTSGLANGMQFVAITGYSQDEYRRRSEEVGFHHYLVKPVNLAELSRVLGLA